MRNLKRFLALMLALLMVLAVCAMDMPVFARNATAVEAAGPFVLVGLVVFLAACAAVALFSGNTGTYMAPNARGDPKGLGGVPVKDQLTSTHGGLGLFKDVRAKVWRPPKVHQPGCGSDAMMSNNPHNRHSTPRFAANGPNSYAFNARDRDGSSAMTCLRSVLDYCCTRLRGAAASFGFNQFCSDQLFGVRMLN